MEKSSWYPPGIFLTTASFHGSKRRHIGQNLPSVLLSSEPCELSNDNLVKYDSWCSNGRINHFPLGGRRNTITTVNACCMLGAGTKERTNLKLRDTGWVTPSQHTQHSRNKDGGYRVNLECRTSGTALTIEDPMRKEDTNGYDLVGPQSVCPFCSVCVALVLSIKADAPWALRLIYDTAAHNLPGTRWLWAPLLNSNIYHANKLSPPPFRCVTKPKSQ